MDNFGHLHKMLFPVVHHRREYSSHASQHAFLNVFTGDEQFALRVQLELDFDFLRRLQLKV